jgi:lactate racemase
MTAIQLAYGSGLLDRAFDTRRFSVITMEASSEKPLSDAEIGSAFDSPIGSPNLDEILEPNDTVLIVVSDATRATASAQIVNLLVRRLIQNGIAPADIAIIFATGIHRAVTAPEKNELLTPFIAQRVRLLEHDASDSTKLSKLGTTARGTPVSLNHALQQFSRIILTGGLGFHYFAGFTGGRKSVCPGLASSETIEQTHMLALDFQKGGRKAGVGAGLLEGNAVHEECDLIAEMVSPAFGINAMVDEKNRPVGLFCGDWRLAHRAGCERYLKTHSAIIEQKRDVVISSCGGFPHDINLIQAHKTLEMASYACNDGGSIILLAECRDGLGRQDFMKWFDSPDSRALEERLRADYEVNGQTAWSLLTKTERYQVYLVSDIPDEQVKRMRMIPTHTLADAMSRISGSAEGFIMPRGAAVLPRLAEE